MTPRRVAVVTAGLSQPSSSRVLADQLATAVRRSLASDPAGGEDTVRFTVIELREHAHELVDNLLTGFPAPTLRAVIDEVGRADGVIAVTPIFNASYSALFKAFFDVLDVRVLAGKPVLIGATGGTERHSLALDHAVRPLFAYLGALVVPTAVYAASSDFGAAGGDTAGLAARIDRAAGEFSSLLTRLEPVAPRDRYADVLSFEQLLEDTA